VQVAALGHAAQQVGECVRVVAQRRDGITIQAKILRVVPIP